MSFETWINTRRKQKNILLMTHIVLGYPDFDKSLELIETMVDAGVDMMELQIPFSEPIADGPVILHANQEALNGGATVEQCLLLAEKVSREFPIPFVVMTYYNILFKYGVDAFCRRLAQAGLHGAIVPDLPPEEAGDYLRAIRENALNPIFIFSPTSSDARLKYLNQFARGFIYCVARKGVTGAETEFSQSLFHYLQRCRQATSLPLALGFGIKSRRDIASIENHADIAVVGSQTLRIMEENGVQGVKNFLHSLM